MTLIGWAKKDHPIPLFKQVALGRLAKTPIGDFDQDSATNIYRCTSGMVKFLRKRTFYLRVGRRSLVGFVQEFQNTLGHGFRLVFLKEMARLFDHL